MKLWDQATDEEKKLYILQAVVYAAYLAYTDHEIGWVIQAVEDIGKLNNTLIIYISGDNGASAEGSPNVMPSEVLQFNGVELPVADQMKFYDAWGTRFAYNHFAVPWARAFDTPYKWTKRIPSFFGGTRPRHGDLLAGAAAFAGSSTTSSTSCRRCWKSRAFPRR